MRGIGHRLLDWGAFALRNPLSFVLTFALGGAFTFAYSYVPLHTVKLQKIERLERSVLAQEERIAALDYEVERLGAAAEGGLDAAAVATLRAEREAAGEENSLLREEVDRAKQRTKRLERERSEWRRRVTALERQLETANTQLAERPKPTPVEEALAPAASAGPAPAGGPPSAPAP